MDYQTIIEKSGAALKFRNCPFHGSNIDNRTKDFDAEDFDQAFEIARLIREDEGPSRLDVFVDGTYVGMFDWQDHYPGGGLAMLKIDEDKRVFVQNLGA